MKINNILRRHVVSATAFFCAFGMGASVTAQQTEAKSLQNANVVQAMASGNIRAATQQTIRLNGANSSSASGAALSYRWTLEAPAGSAARLSNPNAVQPHFTVDLLGDYVAQLVVSDGAHHSAPSVIRISTDNATPVAHAGVSQRIAVGQAVVLDASGSTDPDGDVLAAQWKIVRAPEGSTASVNGDNIVSSFTADMPGDYTVQLDVADSYGAVATSLIELSTHNARPQADAGPNRRAVPGQSLQFDAQGSTDPERSALSYRWSLLHAPARSVAAFSSANSSQPTLTPDQPGLYVVQVAASDGVNKDVFDIAEVMVDAAIGGSDTDTDGDGIVDLIDNCVDNANPSQLDTNGDGFGNRCDADIDNDGFVTNFGDLGLLRLAFFSAPGSPNWNPDADFNGDNVVNAVDLGIMRTFFFQAPGPIAITFVNPAGGSWHDAANWSPAVVPDIRYTVRIDLTGGAVVEYSTGTSEVRGIRTSSPLLISGGTLSVNGNAQFNDTLTLRTTGTLANANVLAPETPAVINVPSSQQGILDRVTLAADVTVSNGGILSVTDRLTFAGGSVALLSTANFTYLNMTSTADDTVLDGVGEVRFGGTTNFNGILLNSSADRLIIGDGVTVRSDTGGGEILLSREVVINGTVINDLDGALVRLSGNPLTVTGSVSASNNSLIRFGFPSGAESPTFLTDTANLTVDGAEVELQKEIRNDGAIEVIDGVLQVGPNSPTNRWFNTGSVTLTDSTLEFGGNTTIDDVGTITGSGELILLGNLDGLGQSFDVADLFEDVVTLGQGGTILDATLIGAPLTLGDFTTFNFDGVTLGTDLALQNVSNLNVFNDLILDEATVSLTSTSPSRIYAQGPSGTTFTFGGSGEILFNGTTPTGSNVSIQMFGPNLVFEPGVTVRSANSGGMIGGSFSGVTMRGTLINDASGAPIDVLANPLVIEGDVDVSNGGRVRLSFATTPGQVSSTATLSADAAELELFGDFTIDGALNATNGATVDIGNTNLDEWTNNGTINIVDSAIEVGGTVTTNGLGIITGSGSSLINGFIDNSGDAFDTAALLPGDVSFTFGGSINGGSIVNTPLVLNGASARLVINDVTLSTLIDVIGAGAMTVNTGLALDNGTIGLNSNNNSVTQVTFGNTETLNVSGQGEIVFRGNTTLSTGNRLNTGNNVDLVMGPDVVLRTETTGALITATTGASSFTMQGTMTSNVPGRQIGFSSDSTVIEGELNIGAGAIIDLGPYTLASGSSVNLDIAGIATSEFGRLRGSTATLDGTLNVALTGGFAPTAGDVFEVATYNSGTGTFASENLPAAIDSTYGATALTLEAN